MYVHGEMLFPDYVALGLLACTLGFLLSIVIYAWWEWWKDERECRSEKSRRVVVNPTGLWSRRRGFEPPRDYFIVGSSYKIGGKCISLYIWKDI